MNDYLCPQCGQAYDLPGVCDMCGVDLQPNDSDAKDKEEDQDEFANDDVGFEDVQNDAETDPLAGDTSDDDDEDDEFDDE